MNENEGEAWEGLPVLVLGNNRLRNWRKFAWANENLMIR
jgi:hypothetical protein